MRSSLRCATAVRDFGEDLRHADWSSFTAVTEARERGMVTLGLGLFIVQTLAEQMGGRVLLSNNAEGGACVTIALALEFVVEKGYNEENNDEKG